MSATAGHQLKVSQARFKAHPQNADRETVVDFVYRARIYFRLTQGLPCKRRRRILSHDDEVLPASYFAEALRNPDAVETAT